MSNYEKKIAIFGGSFDPPTIAHIQTSSEIYNLVDYIDEVWLVPCGNNRSDKNLKATARQRLEMLELAKKDILDENFSEIKVCDYEVVNEKYYPTYELLCNLKSTYPKYKFYVCIGSDLLKGLRKWNDGDKLIRENEFIVICRDQIEKDYLPKNSNVLECNIYGSSTAIRNRIENNTNNDKFYIEGLTSLSIIEYILKNKLYV